MAAYLASYYFISSSLLVPITDTDSNNPFFTLLQLMISVSYFMEFNHS